MAQVPVFSGPVKLNINFKEKIPNAQHVGTIFPLDSGLAWVGFQRPGILTLVSKNGNEKMSISVDFVFKDMVVNSLGEILISEDKGSKVWKYTLSGGKLMFYDASPFETRCMAVATNGNILLCLQRKNSNGKIVELDLTGDVKSEYIKDQDGQSLFKKPDRILQQANNNIVVIDWEMKTVIGLSSDLKHVKFTYAGSPQPTVKSFTPYGISSDKFGHIYITDYGNHNIHVLGPDGVFLRLITFNEFEEHWPRRSVVDGKGLLWIGCNDAVVYTLNLRDLNI